MAKLMAGQALAQVLVNWDIDHIYGIPADSINNTVEGFWRERENLKYIQVRHEEAGTLAAAADAKLTGTIGAVFGSAGPGATHLMNGLYDAKMDRVPLLAIVGQTSTELMNTNYFQELNEDPIFADVALYHKTVTNAAQIPYVIDQAIRAAYEGHGVAVVIVPDNLSAQEIDYTPTKTVAKRVYDQKLAINDDSIAEFNQLVADAKRPVLWIGKGLMTARKEVIEFSEKFSIPVVNTVPAVGIIPDDHPSAMGARGRLGTKPAFEVTQDADLIILAGTNYPFSRYLPMDKTLIQINNNMADLGKQAGIDYAFLADAQLFLRAAIDAGASVDTTDWLKAAQADMINWNKWIDAIADDESKGLSAEAVLREMRNHAGDDDVFTLDVGNNTAWGVRAAKMNANQKLTLSEWFATMGYSLPAGIAAKLSFPASQVWSVSGDGGFAMNMQDLLTEVKYSLPVVNIVLENKQLGFILHEKIALGQEPYGIDLQGADWAKYAESMGAIGFTVTSIAEAKDAFNKVAELQANGNTKPIVIDAKIKDENPIDVAFVPVDPAKFDAETIANYKAEYNVFGQPALSEILADLAK